MFKVLKLINIVAFASTGVILFRVEKAPISLMFLSFFLLAIGTISRNSKNILDISVIKNNRYILYVVTFAFVSFILNYNLSKISSFEYLIFWVINYWITLSFYKNFSRINLLKVLELILIINLVYTLAGLLFQFVDLNKSILQHFVVIDNDGLIRARGIATEPSYSAFISSITIGVILKLKNYKNSINLFAIYFLNIVFLESAYGYMFSLIIFIAFVVNKNRVKTYQSLIGLLLLSLITIVGIFFSFNIYAVERVINSVDILFFSSESFRNRIEVLQLSDSSAFFRVGPSILYLDTINVYDWHFYLGYGSGRSGAFFGKLFYDYVHGEDLDLGLIPAFLYDYGILTTLFVIIFITKLIGSIGWEFKIIVFIFIFNASFNTQSLWYCIVIISIFKQLNTFQLNNRSYSKRKVILNNLPLPTDTLGKRISF